MRKYRRSGGMGVFTGLTKEQVKQMTELNKKHEKANGCDKMESELMEED